MSAGVGVCRGCGQRQWRGGPGSGGIIGAQGGGASGEAEDIITSTRRAASAECQGGQHEIVAPLYRVCPSPELLPPCLPPPPQLGSLAKLLCMEWATPPHPPTQLGTKTPSVGRRRPPCMAPEPCEWYLCRRLRHERCRALEAAGAWHLLPPWRPGQACRICYMAAASHGPWFWRPLAPNIHKPRPAHGWAVAEPALPAGMGNGLP